MFEEVPRGVASVGIYTEMTHDRREDLDYMARMKVNTALISDPTVDKIAKLWAHMLSYGAKKPMIGLRRWDWDDGRRYDGDEGVFRILRDDPIGLAKIDVDRWNDLWQNLEREAKARNLAFPTIQQVRCHLVNEPDTNSLSKQIDVYTTHACEISAEANQVKFMTHNFGTGQPALQVSGPDTSPDWNLFSDSMYAAYVYGHTPSLHEYYNSLGIRHPSQFHWHIFRHMWLWKFLQKWKMTDIEIWMGEWGLEELVNHLLNDHHGWIGRISDKQFGGDTEWYFTSLACFVKRVMIYASDLPDRTWNTFNPRPAGQYIYAAADKIEERMSQIGWPKGCGDISIPTEPEPEIRDIPMWPVDGILTQRFGENPEIYKQYGIPAHNGIDIGASEGTPIVSAADGVVEWVDWDDLYGWYVRIWHESMNMHTLYAHMKSRSFLNGGQKVKRGEPIGYVGSSGNSTGPHLHFETRMGERHRYFDVTSGYRRGRCNPEAIYASYGIEW